MTLSPGAALVYDLAISWQPADSKPQRGHPGEREMCRDRETCLLQMRDPVEVRGAPHPLLQPSQLQGAFFHPRAQAGTWEVSHSRALRWDSELSSAAGLSSVSCPDKTGGTQASFIL